jgi:integrase
MKMRAAHLVPLSDQVLRLLAALRNHTGSQRYLFPGPRTKDRPISDVAINAALRYLGYGKDEICGHGFRTTASTLLNEMGYNSDWIERQLAHVDTKGVRAVYNRAEYLAERRRMMQDWADYLDRLALAAAPGA